MGLRKQIRKLNEKTGLIISVIDLRVSEIKEQPTPVLKWTGQTW